MELEGSRVMYVNLTPHDVCVHTADGVVTMPATGTVARIATRPIGTWRQDGIDTVLINTGEIVGLPDPKDDTIYIVSMPTALAVRGTRSDVVYPHDEVRDSAGRIVGCRGLARIASEGQGK